MRKGKKIKLKKKHKSPLPNQKSLALKKPWIKRTFRHSLYPYLLVISSFRRNVFFNVTNFKGQTKCWTSSGRCGFVGRNRINHMALITVTEKFIERISNQGIRRLILIFKNYSHSHRAIVRGIKRSLKERKASIKFLGLTLKTQNVFNGCRRKKRRRR
jgi:ribosomal protein S11